MTEWKYETPRFIVLLLIGAVGLFNGSIAGLIFCLLFTALSVVFLLKAVICSFSKET